LNLDQRLRAATARLAAAGVESPRREARLLLGHATGLDGAALLRDGDLDRPAPGFDELVARRAAREPLAFILGHQPFWTLDLLVSPATLIPRADSESLVEAALAAFPARDAGRVLDLGTGTGCLLLAVLSEFPAAFGIGVDRSPEAAALARCNVRRTGLGDRAALLCGDWAACLAGQFDLVLSNPPYVEAGAVAGLMPEVARHEPALALDGGPDGLVAYRAILAAIPGLLAPDGVAILELGAGQARDVAALARKAGLQAGTPHRDGAGLERALPIYRPGNKRFGDPAIGH
jgi:release factor glutamine methyltransferase